MPLYAQKLANDPAGFLLDLGRLPFFINDPTFTPAVKRFDDGGTPHDLLKILGRDRVAYASIEFRPENNRFETTIHPTQAEDSIPCYWLPWKKDGALQLKLKPSKKATLQQLPNGFIPTRTANDSSSLSLQNGVWNDRGIEGTDPVLFFTGMMNGCSLFVSGDPTEPTTYHVNRASFQDERSRELVNSNRDRDKDINKLKTNQMVKDFKRFEQPSFFQKTAQVTPVTQHRRNAIGNSAQDAASRERSRLIRGLVNGPPNQAYRIRGHWITAFGVRQNGKWRFYKQDIYQYCKQDQNGNAVMGSEGTTATTPTRFF